MTTIDDLIARLMRERDEARGELKRLRAMLPSVEERSELRSLHRTLRHVSLGDDACDQVDVLWAFLARLDASTPSEAAPSKHTGGAQAERDRKIADLVRILPASEWSLITCGSLGLRAPMVAPYDRIADTVDALAAALREEALDGE